MNPLSNPASSQGDWLWFEHPVERVEVHDLAAVKGAIAYLDQQVQQHGLHAAGFLSYEASPGFDPALRVQAQSKGDRLPLLQFGLYHSPQILSALPADFIAQNFVAQNLVVQNTDADSLEGWQASVTQAEFEAAIAQVKTQIAAGNTFQVNYTFRLRSRFSGNARALFKALMQTQPGNYSAFVETQNYSICSASPELFFTRAGQQITTRPMKGTAARGKWWQRDRQNAQELHNSAKNRAENVMIVDMLRNDLGRIADLGSVQVPHLFSIEQYPTLWQMTSTVTAQSNAPMVELLTALFPCASITGAPKASTMGIIRDLECSPRNIYTGAIGYWGPENRSAQFNVAIRTVLIDRQQQQAEYGVGSGIVWDSDSQAEYEECCLKTAILARPSAEFSLLETLLWEPDTGYFLQRQHLERLQRSAAYFDFSLDLSKIQTRLHAAALGWTESHRVRLLSDRQGRLQLESTPWSAPPQTQPLRVQLAPQPTASDQTLLYHKTSDRTLYNQALQSCHPCDDVLLWNERGEVMESCIANLVIPWQGKLITPPVQAGLLAGTFRAWLLEQGELQEETVTIAMLEQVTEFYLINSLRRWQTANLTPPGPPSPPKQRPKR